MINVNYLHHSSTGCSSESLKDVTPSAGSNEKKKTNARWIEIHYDAVFDHVLVTSTWKLYKNVDLIGYRQLRSLGSVFWIFAKKVLVLL